MSLSLEIGNTAHAYSCPLFYRHLRHFEQPMSYSGVHARFRLRRSQQARLLGSDLGGRAETAVESGLVFASLRSNKAEIQIGVGWLLALLLQ